MGNMNLLYECLDARHDFAAIWQMIPFQQRGPINQINLNELDEEDALREELERNTKHIHVDVSDEMAASETSDRMSWVIKEMDDTRKLIRKLNLHLCQEMLSFRTFILSYLFPSYLIKDTRGYHNQPT